MELLSEIWDKTTDALTSVSEGVSTGLIRLFGNSNERQIRRMRPIVARINELEPAMQALSDDGAPRQDRGVPPAPGQRRDARRRSCPRRSPPAARRAAGSSRCGITTSSSWAAWSCTGATSPRWSPARARRSSPPSPRTSTRWTGNGVHVVTVNDYLARRDAEWMSPLYNGLGMTVGAIQSDMESHERQDIYGRDITYGTNNEFGFDYLRDNMKPTRDLQAQGQLHYAIIDEVDSILIDEARTPLIISGPAFDDVRKYAEADRIARLLKKDAPLRGQGEGADLPPQRRGHPRGRADRRDRELLHPRQHGVAPPHRQRAEGPLPLQARPRLRRPQRRDRHRRRVHRPAHDRPAVVRRPAPGGRGQGAGQDQGREPDARDDHAPELLQALQEALGDDRHGHDRGQRVLQGLQARRDRDPDQPAAHPPELPRRHLPDRPREVRRDPRRAARDPRDRPADPGGHDVDREVGRDLRDAQAARDRAPGPERQVPRARGRDRRAGRPQGRGHDRHQHGGPRHRHHPRRQPRVHGLGRPEAAQRRGRPAALPDPPGSPPRGLERGRREVRARDEGRGPRGRRARAACTSSAPSGTRAAGSTTSSAAARAGRATRGRRGSSSRSKTT